MAGNRAKADVARKREHQAWLMRTQQMATESEIADKLGVTQPAVSKMLAKRRKALVKEITDTGKAELIEQLDQLRYAAKTVWESWQKSIEDHTKVGRVNVEKKTGKVRGTSDYMGEDQETTTTQDMIRALGDLRYYQEFRATLKEIRLLLDIEPEHATVVKWEERLPEGVAASEVAQEFGALMAMASVTGDKTGQPLPWITNDGNEEKADG